MQLEDFDLGQPTNPKIRIIKKGEHMDDYYEPYAIQNKDGHWLYNFKAAKLEAKFLGKKIPTDKQWSELVNIKTDIPNFIYAGYCDGGSCYNRRYNAYYWSSSVYSQSPTDGWHRYLDYADPSVYWDANDQSLAFSVRCLKN